MDTFEIRTSETDTSAQITFHKNGEQFLRVGWTSDKDNVPPDADALNKRNEIAQNFRDMVKEGFMAGFERGMAENNGVRYSAR